MDSIFEFALVIVLGSSVLALAAFVMALVALTRVREMQRFMPTTTYAPPRAVGSVPDVLRPPPAFEPPRPARKLSRKPSPNHNPSPRRPSPSPRRNLPQRTDRRSISRPC
jgi:hypothetical protein